MTHTSTLPNWFSSDICMLANILALEVSWIEEHILSLQWMCVKHWHTGTSRRLLGRRCGELWAPKTGIFAFLWLTMESSGEETLNSVPQWNISQMSVKYLSLSFDCCLYVAHMFLVSYQTQQKYCVFLVIVHVFTKRMQSYNLVGWMHKNLQERNIFTYI